MAPDLPDELLGIDTDDDDSESQPEQREDRAWFTFVGLGEHTLAIPIDDVKTVSEVPDELTRVPRSPDAIEGVADLRGEITVIINPRVHFPTTETRTGTERLVVFDRPADQQSAAMRVDDVLGVDSVFESKVLDREAVEAGDFSTNAMDHPLVSALLEQEREPEVTADTAIRTGATVGSSGGETDVQMGSSSTAMSLGGATDRVGTDGETFTLEDEDETTAQSEEPREVQVELTAVVSTDDLLAASGHNS